MNRTRDLLITSELLYQLSYDGLLIFNYNKFGQTKSAFRQWTVIEYADQASFSPQMESI